jgi:hypothetical protein
MMANAAKDPFWQARVSAEVAAFPALKEVIEDKCTTCHAPAGRTEAAAEGRLYSMEEMRVDPLALDGVTCTVCHQIKDEDLGSSESFSGNYVIENDRLIYGPFDNQFGIPMSGATNYMPVYSEHVTRSELCATCHTLFTPFVDNAGEIAGEFPEQVPYLEWRNSVYPERDVQCQDCHMPILDASIPISTIPPNLTGHQPFWKHYFVGGNVTMLRILQQNIDALGVTAGEADFDSTIARTLRQLQDSTVELSVANMWMEDTLALDVTVSNKAGHKLPSGFPSRRMWIYVHVRDGDNETVFESGEWDEEGRLLDASSPIQPHHDAITSDNAAQVYETIMVDVDDEVTFTLLRGSRYLKDNRIPPKGFTTDHPDYGVASIEGNAADDPDFNRADGGQGTGADIVHYRIGGLTRDAEYTAEVMLLYQSVAPEWIEDLEQYETEEVEAFEEYYEEADVSPTVLASAIVTSVGTAVSDDLPVTDRRLVDLSTYPNPFVGGLTVVVDIEENRRVKLTVFDILGRRVRTLWDGPLPSGEAEFTWDGSDDAGSRVPAGQYIVQVSTRLGGVRSTVIQKVH